MGIDDIDHGHQQAEEADVVAEGGGYERYVGGPAHYGVGRREVFGPEERLAAQLYGRGEEVEHRHEYRQLQQHGQTSRHGVGAGAAV